MLHDIEEGAFDQALKRMDSDVNGAVGIGNIGMTMANGVLTPTLQGTPPLASVTLDGAVFAYGEGEPLRDDRKYLYDRNDVQKYVAMHAQKQGRVVIAESDMLSRAPSTPPAQAEVPDPDQMARDRQSLLATFGAPDGASVRVA